MKYLIIFPLLVLSLASTAQYAAPCDEVPAMNREIVEVLTPFIGKKIDRGECWDAAKLALTKVNADWDGLYVFGRPIDVSKECIQPGDILQFEGVALKYTDEKGTWTESYQHHTAVVYKVNGPGKLEMLHQNTAQYGRKMGVTKMDLTTVTKGKITVYRPVAKS